MLRHVLIACFDKVTSNPDSQLEQTIMTAAQKTSNIAIHDADVMYLTIGAALTEWFTYHCSKKVIICI